ncbi:hypothetical protein P3342_010047 [Pyrenophora teres f. teres]|nr:hypothetical protein P3342_010047 [Pyrenophora teres f. teres]
MRWSRKEIVSTSAGTMGTSTRPSLMSMLQRSGVTDAIARHKEDRRHVNLLHNLTRLPETLIDTGRLVCFTSKVSLVVNPRLVRLPVGIHLHRTSTCDTPGTMQDIHRFTPPGTPLIYM